MSTERIDIRVAENGSRTVKRNLDDIGRSGENAGKGVALLQKAIAGLAVGAGIMFLQRQADGYTSILNRLRLVTTGTENLTRVNDELYASANRTYASYSATAELYGSLARSSEQLGLSQKDLLGITETINQAIAISGTEAATAANGLRQLGQGLASGTLRGDELNSVLENMPRLASAIATGMGVTVGQLRALGAEGKITAEQITDALKKAAPEVAAEFARVNPTIANSFTVLQNSMMRFIGQLNEASGAGAAVGKVLIFLADHLSGIAILAAGIGLAFAWSSAVGMIGAVLGPLIALEKALGAASTAQALFAIVTKYATGALNTMKVALLSNPFTALLVVLALVVAAIVEFGDQVAVTSDGAVTLKDAFFAALSFVMDFVKLVTATFLEVWDTTVSLVSGFFALFGTTATAVLGAIFEAVKGLVNFFIGAWVMTFQAVKIAWNNFPGVMDIIFTAVLNLAAEAAEKVLNAWQVPLRFIAGGLSMISDDAGAALSGFLDSATVKVPRAKLSAAGSAAAGDFKTAFNTAFGTDYVGGAWDAIVARARTQGSGGAGTLNPGGTGTGGAGAGGKGDKGKGASDEETRAEYLAKVRRETELATVAAKSMNFEFMKVDEDLLGINSHLHDKGWAELTTGETSALREKLKAMYDEQDMQDRMKRAYDDFKKPQEDYEKGQEAINRVMKAFPQYAEQGTRALRDLRMEYLATKNDVGSGIELGQLGVQKGQEEGGASRVGGLYQDEYGQANNSLRELTERMAVLKQLMVDDPINSGQYRLRMQELGIEALILKGNMPDATLFEGLTAGFAQFVQGFKGMIPGLNQAWGNFFTSFANGAAQSIGRAIVYGENLGAALKDVAKQALAELLGALIKVGLQWLIMQVIGKTAMATQMAAGIAAGAATAAAWAPAAAMVSLATFGANAAPAMAGIAITTGLSLAMAGIGSALGSALGTGASVLAADGGLIRGPGGPRTDSIPARLSDGEFVVNAAATQRFLPLLMAINSGREMAAFAAGGRVGSSGVSAKSYSRSSGSGDITVTIEDHVGAAYQVERVSADEVRIIAKEVAQEEIGKQVPNLMASELRSPNSRASKALATSTNVRPRR